jgi:hypothetical protein
VKVYASSNGNCLWNAISLALFGNEDNYIILRILTYYMFLLYETKFNLLIQRFEPNNRNLNFFKTIALTNMDWGSRFTH